MPLLVSPRRKPDSAVEMDETLEMTHQMRSQVELLQMKQKELANKMSLRKKMESEHANTISTLDSCLAAQEEYRKGYQAVRRAFIKAKEDLTAMTKAFTDVTKKQREKSKAVMERMVRGTEVTMAMMALEGWKKVMEENRSARDIEKAQAETAEEVSQFQAQMKAFQEQKRAQTMGVMERMQAASAQGLVSQVFKAWEKDWEDWKRDMAEAQAVREKLEQQKAGAKRTLEKNLGMACAGIMASAWKDWLNSYLEERMVNELMGKADAAMQRYKDKKKGESMCVVDRMSKEKNQALMDIVWIVWIMQREMDKYMATYEDEKELLKAFINKQKERSKGVLDRMTRGQESGLTKATFQAWSTIAWENKKARDNEKAFGETSEELAAIREKMSKMEARNDARRNEAQNILNRMNSASITGLLSMVLKNWIKDWEEESKAKREGAEMKARMQSQKMEARRVLEKNLGQAMSGIMGSTFNDWKNHYYEEAMIRQLKGDADKALKNAKDRQKAERDTLVAKMSGAKDKDLIQRCLLIWDMGREMDRIMGNYLEEKELLEGFMKRQKEKSKGVVERMVRGQDSSLSAMCFSGWSDFTADNARAREKEKAQAETQEEMLALQERMKAFQQKKRDEAGAVLERMNAASDSGLVAMCFQSWQKAWEEVQAAKEEAMKMQELLNGKKDHARRVLEKSLASSMGQFMASAFNDWVATWMEEKMVRDMKNQAERQMKSYRESKRDQSMQVVDRMCSQKDESLKQQVMLIWRMLQELNVLHGYVERQKAKSKGVIDNMMKGHDSAKLTIAWQAWTKEMAENAEAREIERMQNETREEMEALQAQMDALKSKKSSDNAQVIEKMNASSDTGLVSLVFKSWTRILEEKRALQEEADRLNDAMKKQKMEARRTLEKNLAAAFGAALASSFNDWRNSYYEERNIREMQQEAERMVKSMHKQRRGENMVIVDKMSKKKDANLCQIAVLVWYLGQELDKVMGNYLEEKEILKAFIDKQKAKSQTVVDRMMKGSDSAKIANAWQAWIQETYDNRIARERERAAAETAQEVEGMQEQMKALRAKKKGEAESIMNKMASHQETGLVAMMYSTWKQGWEANKKQLEEAQKMAEVMKSKNAEARRVLEKNLGMAVSGLVASTFNDWLSALNEEKNIREIQGGADRMLKKYKDKQRDDTVGLVEKLSQEKSAALMQQILMIWILSVSEMIRTNQLQKELKHIIDLHVNMERQLEMDGGVASAGR